jgi:hypothetical protein
MPLVCYLTLEYSWFAPARNGVAAQRKLNKLINENQWDGYIAPTHYFQDVRIILNDFDESEFKKIYPILHEIYWLRHINILAPEISADVRAEIQREFPKCAVYNLGKRIN